MPSSHSSLQPASFDIRTSLTESPQLAKKPNYNFEKSRKEQERKKKKEEKRLRRLENSRSNQDELPPEDPNGSPAPPPE